jgi:hypothetical protein
MTELRVESGSCGRAPSRKPIFQSCHETLLRAQTTGAPLEVWLLLVEASAEVIIFITANRDPKPKRDRPTGGCRLALKHHFRSGDW